ncbi:MAG: hypothetical protein AAB792_02090 [Patescibacteria group bacterium]
MRNPFETTIELGRERLAKESDEEKLFRTTLEALKGKSPEIAAILGLINQEERAKMDQILNVSGLSWRDFEVIEKERKPAIENLLREWLGEGNKEQKKEIGKRLADELAA